MHRDHQTRLRTAAAAVDAVALAGLWLGLTAARAALPAGLVLAPGLPALHELDAAWHGSLVGLVVPAWLAALAQQQAWTDPRRVRADVLALRLVRAAALATLLVLGGLFAAQATETLSRSLVFGFAAASVPVVFAARRGLLALARAGVVRLPAWHVVVVGDPDGAARFAEAVSHHADQGLQLRGIVRVGEAAGRSPLPVLGALDDLPAILAREPVDQVFVTGRAWDVTVLRRVADTCEEQGVRLSMDANFLGLSTARAHLDDIDGQSILSFSSTPVDADALVVKRALDVLVSGALLGLLSPLLVGVSLAIRLSDGGPALFVQTRAGLHGRPFRMLKFRSMVVDAERRLDEVAHLNEMAGPVFKAAGDPRITRLGAVLRRTSVDELPQLWNVLRGEMSLVGPRPPLFEEVARYERWQLRRLSMKPGLTCIWQVSGRNDAVDFDTWMRQDLAYIDNWSLFLDLELLARTVPVVLRGTGAR
jgi:exopolysaccharide biosynthesis polyprenyl glycosylphosphotransferase